MTSHKFGLLGAVAVSALLLAGTAHAVDIIVNNSEIVGPFTLPGVGDTLTVRSGGTVAGAAATAVIMNNTNQTVTNQLGGMINTTGNTAHGILSNNFSNAHISNDGLISTGGFASFGIYSFGADAAISNGGTISTTGNSGYGIVSFLGPDASIRNDGMIRTIGNESFGIVSNGVDAVIRNGGTISTMGNIAYGIISSGTAASINNSGTITTQGNNADGIASGGVNSHILNTGIINVDGDNAYGIASTTEFGFGATANNVEIINTGSVRASGLNSEGIYSNGADATVTNSGTIISVNWNAIGLHGTNPTLNLLAGTAIDGGIQFDVPTSATLNVGTGLNTALTFTTLAAAPLDLTTLLLLSTNGSPFVIGGAGNSILAVIDTTGFSSQDEALADLTGAVTGAVGGRLSAAREGASTEQMAMNGMLVQQAADAPGGVEPAVIWLKGIGSWRDQQADGADVGFENWLGGVVAGVDGTMGDHTRAGLFLGAARAETQTDGSSQEIDSDNWLGGLYAGYTGGANFFDVSVTGGLSEFDSDRRVANNAEPGGIEHAVAEYDGMFISPSITWGMGTDVGNGKTITPSLRVRYAGLFLDGYSETGSAANLTVDDRNIHVFEARAELAFITASERDGGTMSSKLRLGVDGTLSDGGSIDATLLATPISFDAANDTEAARGYAGLDFSYMTTGGSIMSLGAEAGYDTDEALTAQAEAGLIIPF